MYNVVMRKILVFLILLLLIGCSKSTDKMVGQIWIETPNSLGTGFVLNEQYAVTNYHVVQMTRDINILLDGERHKVVKTQCNVVMDIAFLVLPYIHEPPQIALEYEAGDKVNMYDMVRDKTLTGAIQGIESYNGYEYIQTDLDTGPGNSGSPVRNEKGEIIGVHTCSDGEYSYELPIQYVLEQLD